MKASAIVETNENAICGRFQISPSLSRQEEEFLDKFVMSLHREHQSVEDQGLYHLETYTGTKPDFDAMQQHCLVPSISCPLYLGKSSAEQANKDCILLKKKHGRSYQSNAWLVFLIEHFLKPDCIAKKLYPEEFSFIGEHEVNGQAWIKTSKTWQSLYVKASANQVSSGLCFAPIEVKIDNGFEVLQHTVGVNLNNFSEVFKQPGIVSGADDHYKQYQEMDIRKIAGYNRPDELKVDQLPMQPLLERLLLKASLEKNLTPSEQPRKRVAKI